MEAESCRMCGGDGRVSNAFGGGDARCPSCLGTGRRAIDTGFHDVTKTKPSHHRPANRAAAAAKSQAPTTGEGIALAAQIQASGLAAEAKAKLVREIVEYEASHGQCTQTFLKKMRKLVK